MDTLQALVDAVDKAVAAMAGLEASLMQAEATNANHVIDATAVKAQADADAALALSVKADVDAKLKAMADKLAGALPKV